ncbi:MAG: GHKL domain-containing protein [Atopobiaceae bacterium]|nr:GHKL domain-containing protein [Atopobiaceae bacterium]
MGPHANTILRYALELASVIPAAVIALIPVHRSLRRSKTLVYGAMAVVLLAFVVAGSFIGAYFGCASSLVTFAFMPLLLAVYSYVVDLNVGKTLFCFMFSTALCALSTLFVSLLNAPVEATNPLVTFLPETSLMVILAEVVIGILFYRTLDAKLSMLLTEEDLDGSWYPASFAAFLLAAILIWVSPTNYALLLEGRIRTISMAACVIVAIGLVFLIDVIWRLSSHLVENTRLRQENNMLSMEERRYAQLRSYMNQTRELRHDFRQHMRVISGLVHGNQIDELTNYVDQINQMAGQEHRRLCANHAFDAVASYYEAMAAEQGATIEWSLDVPEEVFIKEADLCSIIGNLVENALQAVSKLPADRQIVKVTVRLITEAMLGITVKNPYEGKIRMGRNGLPRTYKRGHGIGLASVSAIAKRYGGTCDIDVSNGQFAVSILMYGEEKNAA